MTNHVWHGSCRSCTPTINSVLLYAKLHICISVLNFFRHVMLLHWPGLVQYHDMLFVHSSFYIALPNNLFTESVFSLLCLSREGISATYKIHTCVKKVPTTSSKRMRKKIRKAFFQFLHVDFVSVCEWGCEWRRLDLACMHVCMSACMHACIHSCICTRVCVTEQVYACKVLPPMDYRLVTTRAGWLNGDDWCGWMVMLFWFGFISIGPQTSCTVCVVCMCEVKK